jgi:GGDEF domain-containing protein
VQHDDAGEFLADTRTDGSGAGAPSTVPEKLPGTRVRPLTRRRHVRVPGATAAAVERLAWGEAEAGQQRGAVAVSVVPGASLPAGPLRPAPAGADLDALLGDEELGCRPGRHRRDRTTWQLLRRVPGWRPSTPAWDADDASDAPAAPDRSAPTTDPTSDADVDAAQDGVSASGPDTADLSAALHIGPDVPDAAVDVPVDEPAPAEPPVDADADTDPETGIDTGTDTGTELDDEIAAAADLRIPVPRDGAQPWYRQRRRRSPAPSLRAELQAAGARLQQASGQAEIARVAAQEAARLVLADVSALVLRAVEGPRVLWLHPGGPDAGDLWGPATLNALLGVGHPVRRVVEGDPLADGGATALLSVPVPSGGAIAGTLITRRHEPRAFSATEQDVLSRLARMAGAALLASARRAAFGRGELDDVTGLPGGRRLAGDVAAAVRTADRAGMPVSVLAAHVQGLARLRTELGDQPADELLGALARAFASVLRVGDVAYRIGEDEFALLLPATDADGVPPIGQRLATVTAEVVAASALPGSPRPLGLRTAVVPLDAVRAGADAVDAATRALELDRQRVRWTKGPGAVSS